MTKRAGSLVILASQLLLLSAVVAKYHWDRDHYPHVWLKAQVVDPESLTRGRYLQIRVRKPSGMDQIIPYYLPEHAPNPAQQKDLYVEVTVPPNGALRALRLGLLKDGTYAPLGTR